MYMFNYHVYEHSVVYSSNIMNIKNISSNLDCQALEALLKTRCDPNGMSAQAR